MSCAIISFTLVAGAPRLTADGAPPLLTPFGRWLRERLRRTLRESPGLACRRLRFTSGAAYLALAIDADAPTLVVGLALSRTLTRSATEAARATGWIGPGERLWQEGATRVWCWDDAGAERRVVGRRGRQVVWR